MHLLDWLDNWLFSTLISVIIFLLVMTAISKITIPRSELLTSQIRIIEEIRKYIRPPEPVLQDLPRPEVKTIQPRKRIVPEQVTTALNRLRESQSSREVKVIPRSDIIERPKLDLKRPSPRRRTRDSISRIKIDDPSKVPQTRKTQGDLIDREVIEVAAGSGIVDEGKHDPTLRGFAEGGKEGPADGAEDEVAMITIEPFADTRSGEDLISGMMQPLIAWLRENPAELSPVEGKFLRQNPGDLASRVVFLLEDETRGNIRYELLLLFKPSIDELRICLIDGNTAIQLIDKGLQERSNYLRIGSVMYSGSEKISIQSTQIVPSEEATRRFYQIFLSWWNRTRKS